MGQACENVMKTEINPFTLIYYEQQTHNAPKSSQKWQEKKLENDRLIQKYQPMEVKTNPFQQLSKQMEFQEQIQLEDQSNGIDDRKPVLNTKVYPYNGIGKIIAHFTHPTTKKYLKKQGTAFLITEQYILTVFHIFFIPDHQFIKPDRIQFFPEPLKKSQALKNGIQAQIAHFDKKYFELNETQRRQYDCTLLKLKLKPQMKIPKQNVLKCILNYSLSDYRNNLVEIPSYPNQQDLKLIQFKSPTPITNSLCYDQNTLIVEYKSGIVQYHHSTRSGASGAPLLLKKSDNSFQAIGLHIGKQGNKKCAILLKKCALKSTIHKLTKTEVNNGNRLASITQINYRYKQIFDNFIKKFIEKDPNIFNQQEINLRNNQITDEGLKALAQNGDKFKSLQRIDLSNNQITDEGLKALAQNGNKFESLQVIGLSNNQITDEGLKALAQNGDKFKSLQKIYLPENQITYEGLKALAQNVDKFKSLQEMFLYDNLITEKGKTQMKSKLKNLKFQIIY